MTCFRMLRGLCDGEILLDSNLRVVGKAECLRTPSSYRHWFSCASDPDHLRIIHLDQQKLLHCENPPACYVKYVVFLTDATRSNAATQTALGSWIRSCVNFCASGSPCAETCQEIADDVRCHQPKFWRVAGWRGTSQISTWPGRNLKIWKMLREPDIEFLGNKGNPPPHCYSCTFFSFLPSSFILWIFDSLAFVALSQMQASCRKTWNPACRLERGQMLTLLWVLLHVWECPWCWVWRI